MENREIAERLLRAYQTDLPLDFLPLVKNFRNRILVIDNGILVYAKLKDDDLEKLKSGFWQIGNTKDLIQMLNSEGNNIHFILLVAKGTEVIRRMFKSFPSRTISWFRPDMSKLVVFNKGGLQCLG